MVKIRQEQPQDLKEIRELNIRAFGQNQEADIVDNLRKNCPDIISLVAIKEGQVVGHTLFSSVIIESEEKTIKGVSLAPMAVIPEYQRQGIGSKLVHAGIEEVKKSHSPFVIVLGHADYYPRFGFERASIHGIRCEWDVPDDAFMILVLDDSELRGISGVARYHPEFSVE